MAEFCKECFKKKIIVPSDNITDDRLVMSEELDFCEGCGEWKPVVLKVKTYKCFEEELQDYICDLCEKQNIPPVDLRFRCFGDMNRFWSSKDNSYFELDCVSYYANDIEDVKKLFSHIIDVLWEQATQPNHRIALYLKNIINKGNWIDVEIGSCLLEDDGILGWKVM